MFFQLFKMFIIFRDKFLVIVIEFKMGFHYINILS